MNTHRSRWAFACLFGLALTAGTASAAIINVPADFATISEAVAVSQLGDTVLVQEGVYEEGFTIPEGVTVLAAGEREATWVLTGAFEDRIAFGPGSQPAVLEGLTILLNTWLEGPTDIDIENPHGTLRNVDIYDRYTGGAFGQAVDAHLGCLIEHCRFMGGEQIGVEVHGGSATIRYSQFHYGCDSSPSMAILIYESADSVEVRNSTFGYTDLLIDCDSYAELVNNIFNAYTYVLCGTGSGIVDAHHNLFNYSGFMWCDDGQLLLGPGNIWDEDPLFCDYSNCDFRVDAGSPAVGAGENGETIGAYGVGCGVLSSPIEASLDGVGRPAPNPSSTAVSIPVIGDDWQSVDVFDPRGRLLRVLVDPPVRGGKLSWDGLDGRGMPVPSGRYMLRLRGSRSEVIRSVTIVR